MTPTTINNPLRNDIQGLRAIAVLSVIFFHLNKNWLPGGFIGVDIFFVISGFLITQIILRKKYLNSFSLRNFYLSRLQRILPAYLTLIVIASFVAAVFFTLKDFEYFRKSVISALFFNSNYFFSKQGDYFSPASYELLLLHTWSLAIEMQFYLLLPVALLVIPKRFLVATLLLTSGILIAYSEFRLQTGQQQKIYFSLLARIPEFLVGSLTALIPQNRVFSKRTNNTMAAVGLALVLWSAFFITEKSTFPGLLALLPCLGIAILLTSQSSLPNRLLSFAPLVFLGALSYSLYLWHWPILAALRYVSGSYLLNPLATVAFFILTLACGYLSYRYIETPYRKRLPAKSASLRLAGLAVVSVILVTAANVINSKLLPPLDEHLTRYAVDADICHGIIVGDCTRGDKSSEKMFLMLGDSHAAQLNLFADIVGNATHTRIKVISSSSCVTIPGFDVDRIPDWAHSSCKAQIQEGEKYTTKANGIIIAGMWQYHVSSPQFLMQLDRFLSAASAKSLRVLILAQVPMFSTNPQRADRLNKLGIHSSTTVNTEWANANLKIRDITANHENAVFLDLSGNSIFSKAPLLNNKLMYLDTHHLNEFGATQYGITSIPFVKSFIDSSDITKNTETNLHATH